MMSAPGRLENSARASAQLTELTRPVGRSADAIARAAEALRTTASDTRGGVQQFRADTLPALERLLADARAATASLAQLAQQLERNPNALLTGREPLPPGPGE